MLSLVPEGRVLSLVSIDRWGRVLHRAGENMKHTDEIRENMREAKAAKFRKQSWR